MSMLENVSSEIVIDPPRLVIFGKPKVGKSTLTSQSNKPLTLCFEDGVKNIRTPSLELKTYEEMKSVIHELITTEHDYKTLIIDSITFLEKCIHAHVCFTNNATSIANVMGGYGNGYAIAEDEVFKLLTKLDELVKKKRMMIVFIGHQVVREDLNPTGEDFKISAFDGNKKIVGLLERWSDGIIMMAQESYTTSEDKGFGNKTTKAIGTPKTVLICGGSAGTLAKTRYALPDKIPVTETTGWNTLMENIKKGI